MLQKANIEINLGRGMNKLIIAEKPSVALRVALSLGDSQPKRYNINGVGYFEVQNGNDTLYIVAAAGHLFTLQQINKDKKELPIFDIQWIPSYKTNESSYFTKKYLDTITDIAKKCNFFINACDYDLEGTVIGTNILKLIINQDVNKELNDERIGRMRFSTTTKPDLIKSYNETGTFDFNNFSAGEARHMLDWYWGINLSRALMQALGTIGIRKVLSVGRVQGPTLGILAKRELEIKNFVPKPLWRIFIKINDLEIENKKGNIFDKNEAQEIFNKSKNGKAIVEEIESKEELHSPFPPFDLTSLQLEASRVFRIDPSRTLALAQSLYEKSYISYPRTSSQKLPYTLGLKKIIEELSKNEVYSESAKKLIDNNRIKPHEGAKQDEAHPAIYPTGVLPKKLTPEENKIYDLIVKRFLACFAEYWKGEKTSLLINIDNEKYSISGEVIKDKGWLQFYNPYYKPKEILIPKFEKGSEVKVDSVNITEGKTEPPNRYGKAGLISLLEKKELGTKATRAAIIDTLFDRGYITNSRIEVTEFGMSVYKALNTYSEEILNEEMTRKLEEDMEKVAKGELKEDKIIEEGQELIKKIVEEFNKNGKEIGKALAEGLKESEKLNVLGKCNKCDGELLMRKSRIGKSFVGCSNWPKCNNTFPLPQYAKIIPLNKTCEKCNTPKVKVFSKGKVFEMCLDPNCETKKNWGNPNNKLEEKSKKIQTTDSKNEKVEIKKAKKLKKTKRKTSKKQNKKSFYEEFKK
ncbi:MAG: DNA topoisomerase I [Candidatus Micrarchaeaceae archaeon]